MSTLIMISMSYVTCLVMVGYHNRWGEFDFNYPMEEYFDFHLQCKRTLKYAWKNLKKRTLNMQNNKE